MTDRVAKLPTVLDDSVDFEQLVREFEGLSRNEQAAYCMSLSEEDLVTLLGAQLMRGPDPLRNV